MQVTITSDLDEAIRRLGKKVGAKSIQKASKSEMGKTLTATRAAIVKGSGADTGLSAKDLRNRTAKQVKRDGSGIVWLKKGSEGIAVTRYRGRETKNGIILRGKKGFKRHIPDGFAIYARHSRFLPVRKLGGRLTWEKPVKNWGNTFLTSAKAQLPRITEAHAKRVFKRLERKAMR